VNGLALPVFDGSSWYPFSGRLLFTAELGSAGGLWQATPDFPSAVTDLAGIFGRGGYEGTQADSAGNVWVIEDVGGKAGSGALAKAKQPNSFVYRFVPRSRWDLTAGGRLQVLQVRGLDGIPIVFGGDTQAQIDASITSQAEKDLHTYGNSFQTTWVTIHDTAVTGFVPFDANALAKASGGTPFKRPENGQFRPDTGFREVFFDETGDTNADSAANAQYGGWGSIMRLTQRDPSSNSGVLTPFYIGDQAHTGLDNTAFISRDQVVFVEDAGDGLHGQRNAPDSGYVFDTRISGPQTPIRFLAEGRDASATIDSALGSAGIVGFQNEGDNELTGFHVSDGDPSVHGLIGTESPDLSSHGDDGHDTWRVFFTQQHGDNVTYEISARR
jgi:secreted PhoX family phosphatase